ncbi:MAG: phosphatidate cytidylyltransferase [Gammaproteobacteria bacterium]|jgi:phosphatidate cytidylyltransferase
MLKQRILTAIILIPLVLWGILRLPDDYFAIVLALLTILGAREWASMARLPTSLHYIYTIVFAGILYACWFGLHHIRQLDTALLYTSCAWWIFAFVALAQYNSGKVRILFNPALRSVIGLLILVPTFTALLILRNNTEHGATLLIYLLVLIWIADSAAYFTGRQWGKTKLLPNVSPGKTWQGVYGALVASISFSFVFAYFAAEIINQQYMAFIGASFITIIFSIHGDLVESMFKRQVNIKDSSHILPGHGGILDRIDSLTSASPVFVTSLMLLGIK